MATRLYFAPAAPILTPSGVDSNWNAYFSLSACKKTLSRVQGQGGYVSASCPESSTTNPYNYMGAPYLSETLAAQSVSGTVTLVVEGQESEAAANAYVAVMLYVIKSDGTSRGTLLSFTVDGTELGVSPGTNRVVLDGTSLSSVSASAGDRICMELGFQYKNSKSTVYTGSYNQKNLYSTDKAKSDGAATYWNAWLEFSADLTFQDPAHTLSTADGYAFGGGTVELLFKTNNPEGDSLEYHVQIDQANTFDSFAGLGREVVSRIGTNVESAASAACEYGNYAYFLRGGIAYQVLKSTFKVNNYKVAGVTNADSMCCDASYLYYTDTNGLIGRLSLSDFSTETTRTTTGMSSVYGITQDATYVYICGTSSSQAAVLRLSKSDFTTQSILLLGLTSGTSLDIINDATYIYSAYAGYVIRILKSDFSTFSTKNITNAPVALATDGTYLYAGQSSSSPLRLTRVLLADFTTTNQWTKTGTWAYGIYRGPMALKNGKLYFPADGDIYCLDLTDFSTSDYLAGGLYNSGRGVAVDDDYVYYNHGFTYEYGSFQRYPVNVPLMDAKSSLASGFSNTESGGDTHPFNNNQVIKYAPGTLAEGTYYWRMRSRNLTSYPFFTDWTTTRYFTVGGDSVSKINGVSLSSISKVNSIAKASISKINGVSLT